MTELVALTFKAEALEAWQLPNQEYYLPREALLAGLDEKGSLQPELLLHGLQCKLAKNDVDPNLLYPAMFALFETFYEAELENENGTEGNNWSVKYGDIDLATEEIVTIQRQNRLLAAFKQDGPNLVICTYEPLDDDSLSSIKDICQDVDEMAKETVTDKKLQYAARRSNGFGQMYAADAGKSYVSYWQHGLGISNDGTLVEPWSQQINLKAIPSMHIGTQLQVHDFFNQQNFSFQKYFSALSEKVEQQTTKEQADNHFWNRTQFIGCLLGGAIGDAFGAPVEFMPRKQILAKHGSKGVTSLLPAYGRIGAITDDTQMTLFTAEGLLRAWVRGKFKGITSELSCIGHAYQRWYQTQGFESPECLYVECDGYLWQQRELHSQRAPGNTCLSALAEMESFEAPAMNNSKGCGGVMRVAPIGLYCWRLKKHFSVDECFQLASDAAHLTHGHTTGYLAAGAFAAIIYQILEGDTLLEGCNKAIEVLANQRFYDETVDAIQQAITLAETEIAPHEAIQKLGEGWIAEEALAISIYCVLVAKNFKDLMNISVSHDGDSDSTGAIAGNIWGAQYGIMDWPKEWTDELELCIPITEIAGDLYDFHLWEIGEYSTNTDLNNLAWTKYPGV
jgi:ADP-ribosylglycohydrolase